VEPNQQQVEAWNGGESVHYVDHADRYDRQLAPFADALLDAVGPVRTDRVLDVGCGCGATTLAAARAAGVVLGVDVSVPLLEVARARAASLGNVDFVVADAQTHRFDDGAFDVVISQFGSMFFDEPVAAFANLRRSLAPGGRLALVTWQELAANEWLTVVASAVARRAELPSLGGRSNGPGMFFLQDPDETSALLGSAGFTDVEIEPLSPSLLLAGGGTLDESVDFLVGMGMVRGLLGRIEDAADRDVALEEVRAALAEHLEPGVGVRLGAAGWLVTARP
jgi:SAM-dependent methyltransferase